MKRKKHLNDSSKTLLKICFFSLTLTLLLFCGCNKTIPHSDYIRFHVRADSNESEAQEVKLKVRDAVVAYLTVEAKGVGSRDEMKRKILENIPKIEEIANGVLKENGFTYLSTARLAVESFPEKSYGDLTLEKGDYEALIIELGSGKGNNWWCVAYPPLCFIAAEDNGTDGVEYRSIIADFFKNLK